MTIKLPPIKEYVFREQWLLDKGIDLDGDAIAAYQTELGVPHLFVGDVEHLERVDLQTTVEVILLTDLLEHLSCPGLALEGVKRFMTADTELVITVPHAFGLPNTLRYALGGFREGEQHVATFNSAHLDTLLDRHGFQLTELCSGFERYPASGWRKVLFPIPLALLRRMPRFGGTLIATATLRPGCADRGPEISPERV